MTTITVKGKVAEIFQEASTKLGDKADDLIYDAISNLLRTESLPSSHRKETGGEKILRELEEEGLIGFFDTGELSSVEYAEKLRKEAFPGN